MAHDAFEPSLSEHGRTPEQRVEALEAVLEHLVDCITRTELEVNSNRLQIGRAAALAKSAEALAERAPKAARAAAREELLRVAAAANGTGEGDGPRHEAPGKRDRHGMYLVRGLAAVAGLWAFARSPWARGVHRAVTVAAMATLGGAATIAGPSLMMPGPSPAPAAVVPAHHHQSSAPSAPGTVPAPSPSPHHARHHRAARAAPSASPAVPPLPSPAPSPEPSVLPSATVPPTPEPEATATPPCHGKGCHPPGDAAARILSVLFPQWQH